MERGKTRSKKCINFFGRFAIGSKNPPKEVIGIGVLLPF